MARKAHTDFQNCLPDNKLGRNRILSVRGLVTHDWRNVGDGIRSRAREDLFTIHSATKMEILFLKCLRLIEWRGALCILDGMAKATDNTAAMQLKLGIQEAIPLTTNNSVARYSIVALCNKCGGIHDMAVTVILKDGPIEKQSIGDLYDEKTLPKNLADLTSRSISCPKTGRQSIQKDNHQIFLVPAKN